MRRLLDRLPMLLVLAASLTLLVTVGLGEAHRVNPRLQLERLAVQGEVIRDPIDTFLQAGQPLEQFVGFETRARGLIASDPRIAAIELVGAAGGIVSAVHGAEARPQNYTPASVRLANRSLEVMQSDDRLQVRLPLSNRFQQVGELRLSIARAVVDGPVDRAFLPAIVAAAVCLVLFGALQTRRRQSQAADRDRLLRRFPGGGCCGDGDHVPALRRRRSGPHQGAGRGTRRAIVRRRAPSP